MNEGEFRKSFDEFADTAKAGALKLIDELSKESDDHYRVPAALFVYASEYMRAFFGAMVLNMPEQKKLLAVQKARECADGILAVIQEDALEFAIDSRRGATRSSENDHV